MLKYICLQNRKSYTPLLPSQSIYEILDMLHTRYANNRAYLEGIIWRSLPYPLTHQFLSLIKPSIIGLFQCRTSCIVGSKVE